MLSVTWGIRAHSFCIDEKMRAFFAEGILEGDVMGRNSATGSPRRSIRMMAPSAASRTSSEVWMWSSRTEVFRMCHIVAQHCTADVMTAHCVVATGQHNHFVVDIELTHFGDYRG